MEPWEASARRSQAFVLVLGIGLLAAATALAEHRVSRLAALLADGKITAATVIDVSARNGDRFTHYRYDVNGTAFDWDSRIQDAPFSPGETFPIRYLPGDPSLCWPDGKLDATRIKTEVHPIHIGGWVLFSLLVLPALLGELRIRRRKQGDTGPLFTLDQVGRGLAVLFTAIVLGVNFFDDVRAVQAQAFGEQPFGAPVAWVVSGIELLLFFPPLWGMTTHLMRIVQSAMRDGASLSKFGLAVYILRSGHLHPELRRSRVVVLAGAAYFFAIMVGWIAFATAHGI